MKRLRWGAAGIAVIAVLALALAPAALAQSSSVDTYSGQGGNKIAQVKDPGSGSANTSASGSLPFTGFDLILAAGGGLLLLGAGVALSRAIQTRPATGRRGG
jgi:hypothetical protein